MITPYFLKELLFLYAGISRYSVSAATQAWVSELVAGWKKLYQNNSSFVILFTFLPVKAFISVCHQREDGKNVPPLSLKGSGIMPSLHCLL